MKKLKYLLMIIVISNLTGCNFLQKADKDDTVQTSDSQTMTSEVFTSSSVYEEPTEQEQELNQIRGQGTAPSGGL
jgi:outer membrane lipopolysaccharide assembly protein LptE/RlpB